MGRISYWRLAFSATYSIAATAGSVMLIQNAFNNSSLLNVGLAIFCGAGVVADILRKSLADEVVATLSKAHEKDSPEWGKLVGDLVKDIESSVREVTTGAK